MQNVGFCKDYCALVLLILMFRERAAFETVMLFQAVSFVKSVQGLSPGIWTIHTTQSEWICSNIEFGYTAKSEWICSNILFGFTAKSQWIRSNIEFGYTAKSKWICSNIHLGVTHDTALLCGNWRQMWNFKLLFREEKKYWTECVSSKHECEFKTYPGAPACYFRVIVFHHYCQLHGLRGRKRRHWSRTSWTGKRDLLVTPAIQWMSALWKMPSVWT